VLHVWHPAVVNIPAVNIQGPFRLSRTVDMWPYFQRFLAEQNKPLSIEITACVKFAPKYRDYRLC
jgi:hypothetical protein